ncbi:c-type cytochrome [Phenylobacterium sp.]|uniref:c-type cytochrome n=1 Tax=Phenylobacterium sp. TaxID=1871053 RepID=UPI002FC62E94
MRVVPALALVAASLCAKPAAAADGASLYKDNCAACHRPTGQGIPGAFPALAGSKFVQGDAKEPIGRVLHGRGGMPSFQDELTDLQIATILSYVRVSWGNKGKPINPTQVTALRGGGKRENAKAVLQAH